MSRRKRGRPGPHPGSPQSSPRIDYSGFGPYGPQFQRLHEKQWRAIEDTWKSLPAQIEEDGMRVNRPRMLDVLAQQFDRSGWFFERLVDRLAIEMEAMDGPSSIKFWEALRGCFSPPLGPAKELAGDRRAALVRTTFVRQAVNPGREMEPLYTQKGELNNVCHGPFTEQEMAYLLRRYPRVVQVGAGSAYLAWELMRRGGDIVAQDNNKWNLTQQGLFPWTDEVFRHGRLIVTDEAQSFVRQYADRTLLITWPEGGAAFPSLVLESYAAAGGKFFLLKLGGFVGYGRVTQDPSYAPSANAPENVAWFFQLLSKDWEEVQDHERPRWNPWAWGNNMLVFRRRS